MKNVPRRLWLLPCTWADPGPVACTAPEEEIVVAILEVESLYADPKHISLESFLGKTEIQTVSRPEGSIVTVTHRALDTAMSHAQAHPAIEVGGLCLGYVFRNEQDDRFLVRVEEMVPAEHTSAGMAHVTFTYETWQRFIDVQTHDFPDMRLLGWYHSHPGFGVFLSSMDRFIHDNFFAAPWHVAMVIESSLHQVGVFTRHDGEILSPEVIRWPSFQHSGQQPRKENDTDDPEE